MKRIELKFTPFDLLRLIVGLIAVLDAFLGIAVMRQQWERSQLIPVIALASSVVTDTEAIAGDKGNLELQLKEAKERFAALQTALPPRINDAEVIEAVLRQAQESRVTLQDATSAETKAQKVREGSYETVKFELRAIGSEADLLGFVTRLNSLKGAASSSVKLNRSPEGFAASVTLEVYARPPVPSTPQPKATPAPSPAGDEEMVRSLRAAASKAQENGDWRMVVALLAQIRGLRPADQNVENQLYSAHLAYGRELLSRGDTEEASRQFRYALSLRPQAPEAQDALRQADRVLPPTPTFTPVLPTPMFTPVPPTPMFTPVPPTPMFTPVPPTPTFTPVLPTPTFTPTPTAMPPAVTKKVEITYLATDKTTYNAGERVSVQVWVKNTGNVALSRLRINVDIANPSGQNVQQGIFLDGISLAVGEEKRFIQSYWIVPSIPQTGTYTVTAGLHEDVPYTERRTSFQVVPPRP